MANLSGRAGLVIRHRVIRLARSAPFSPIGKNATRPRCLIDEMRARVTALAGADYNIQKQQQGPGSSQPIRIDIVGISLDEIGAATSDMIARMNEIGGFIDVTDSRPLPGTEWSLVTDRDAASRHGVSISGLGMMIKMLTRGMRISDYRPDDSEDELDVVMRFMGDQRNLDRLKELRVPTTDGSYVPLSVFASLEPTGQEAVISNAKMASVTCIFKSSVKTGLLPADMIEKLRQSLLENPINNAVDIQFGGEGEDIAETQNFLGKAFGISLLLMVIVLDGSV